MLDANHLLWTQIAAGFCVLMTGALFVSLFRQRVRMAAARSWINTDGSIIASDVRQPPSHLSDDLNDASPIVRYRYRVSDQDFESEQVAIGDQPLTTRVLAGRLVARYPVGARVDVYVDPGNPANAILEPRQPATLMARLAFAVAFGGIAAILVAHAVAGKVIYAEHGVPLFAFAVPMVCFLIAVFGVVAFARGRRLAKASAAWPTVPGTITNSSVIEEMIEEKDNNDSSIIRKVRRYQVDLRYAYQLNRRDYVGTVGNWGWVPIYGLPELAEAAASHYSPGQSVIVYYDPERPGHAVLEPGNRQGSLAPLIAAAIGAVFGAVFLTVFLLVGFGG